MRTAVVVCKPDSIQPGLSRNNLRTRQLRAAFEKAVAAVSASDPSTPFGAGDVTANMQDYPVKPCTDLSVRRLLAAEAQDPRGLVSRAGLGLYLSRQDAERVELLDTPRLRVQQAAEQLAAAGAEQFTVQQLLQRVNQAQVPLSQRAVYYAVRDLLGGAEPVLVRAAWGQYARVRGIAGDES